jgi:hypothetical protein
VRNARKDRSSISGQAITEYIILLLIVVIGLGFFVRQIGVASGNMTAGIGGKLEKQLRTGSAPPDIWTK